MDLYENYSDNELDTVRELIEYYGVQGTMDLLESARMKTRYWKKYIEDREKEKDGGFKFSQDPNDEEIITKMLNRLTNNAYKTEKLDKEAEEREEILYNQYKMIFDILRNDEEAIERISDVIAELEYDPDDIESRMNMVNALISVLNEYAYKEPNDFLEEGEKEQIEKYTIIYQSISEKLKELNYEDFMITYKSVHWDTFFKNPYFTETTVDRIKEMNEVELIQFMVSTQDGMEGRNEAILEARKEKIEEFNDPFVTEAANKYQIYYMPKINTTCDIYDKTTALFKGTFNDDSKKKLEIYASLTDAEFILFLLKYSNNSGEIDQELIESELTDQRLSQLTRRNMILLVEVFLDRYINYLEIKDNPNLNDSRSLMVDKQWKKIIKEAQKRGLISEDYQKLYNSVKENFYVNKALKVYEKVNKYSYFDNESFGFYTLIEEDEYNKEVQSLDPDEMAMEDNSSGSQSNPIIKKILIKRFNGILEQIEKSMENIENLFEISQKSNRVILQEVNKLNVETSLSAKDGKPILEENLSEQKQRVIREYRRRVLGMPEGYTAFLQPIANGVLLDVVTERITDFQEKVRERREQEEDQR